MNKRENLYQGFSFGTIAAKGKYLGVMEKGAGMGVVYFFMYLL